MYNELCKELNITRTENGAVTNATTGAYVLDLFATIGAMRSLEYRAVIDVFEKAFLENPTLALKTLFYARDIRGGLGERRVFRNILTYLAHRNPESVKKNLWAIEEYGRLDDLLALMKTPCEGETVEFIKNRLNEDLNSDTPSLLAKWLPSVNTSSSYARYLGKRLAKLLGMSEKEYRKTLAVLRGKIRIIENKLRTKEYTFDYEKQSSGALFKYKSAFIRNDGERYSAFINKVEKGESTLKADKLYPYQVISKCICSFKLTAEERLAVDATWTDLKRNISVPQNAIAVVDTSGSMEWSGCGGVRPIDIAISLGILFGEKCEGEFSNSFITFSSRPSLVKIVGKDIYEKSRIIKQNAIVSNTNIDKVFSLILSVAQKNNLPQSQIPETIYIISDMEFDCCADNAKVSNFDNAKAKFEEAGYKLPKIVFWCVSSRHGHQPVTQNDRGVMLVSGASPSVFKMVAQGDITPYRIMLDTLLSPRYEKIVA